MPLLPGKMELSKKFEEENGGHGKEHDEFYKIAGVTREQVWIQHSPPGSGAPDLEIVSLETENPANDSKRICYVNSSMGYKVSRLCKRSIWNRFFKRASTASKRVTS